MRRFLRRILPGEPVFFDSEWARDARIAWSEACLSAALDALPPAGPDDKAAPCWASGHDAPGNPPDRSPAALRIKPWRERLVE